MEWSPQQDAALKAVSAWLKDKNGPQVFRLFGFAGTGKEQPISSLVQTPTGPQRIGDIRVGDSVLGKSGRPIKVVGVFPQGKKPVYRVTFRDGASARCGHDHLWEVKDGRNWKTLPLKDIIKIGIRWNSGSARFQIPLCDPVQYDMPQPAFDPYVIGVLIGDGYLHGNCVVFSTPDIDVDIVERVKERLVGFDLRRDDIPSCPRYLIKDPDDCHHNRLKFHLESVGLCVRSTEKFIPEQYLYSPIECRVELLRGLMDTDGSSAGNRIGFHTSSKRLARDFVHLVQSLGGVAIVKSYQRDGVEEFQINVKTTFIPFHSARKGANWSASRKNPPSRYIWDIVEDGEEDQVCIKVDADDHLYLTDDFIVTHNTTLATHFASDIKRVIYAAFTGKAALVMRKRGCEGASTIHSLIYRLEEEKAGEPKFILNEDSAVKYANLVVIDEVSMVGEELAYDLLSFGTKVLVLGDPFQLPPVKDTGFFTDAEPDIMLTEIHRQARDNPIIQMSMNIREGNGLDYGAYGESKVIRRNEVEQNEVIEADQIIVGLNRTRQQYNARMRYLKGIEDSKPVVGERVICLRNNRIKNLLNGQMWTVNEVKPKGRGEMEMMLDPEDAGMRAATALIHTHENFFLGKEEEFSWEERRRFDEFTYGYSITCHKSQGSQFDNVYLFDESAAFKNDRDRWLYTAVTRAAERITVVA